MYWFGIIIAEFSTNTNTIPALWYFNTIQYVLFICVGHGWVQLLTGLSEQEAAGNTQDQQDFFGGEWSWRGTTLLMEIIFKTDYIFVVPRDDPDKQSGSQSVTFICFMCTVPLSADVPANNTNLKGCQYT